MSRQLSRLSLGILSYWDSWGLMTNKTICPNKYYPNQFWFKPSLQPYFSQKTNKGAVNFLQETPKGRHLHLTGKFLCQKQVQNLKLNFLNTFWLAETFFLHETTFHPKTSLLLVDRVKKKILFFILRHYFSYLF